MVVGTAVLAAWIVVLFPGGLTVLWMAVALGALAIAPAARFFVHPAYGMVGAAMLAVGWAQALDRELYVDIILVWVLGAVLFGLARLAALDDRILVFLALLVAATAAIGILQVAGVFNPNKDALTGLLYGFHDAALVRMEGARAMGTARLPGHFAALLLMVVPLLLAAVANETRWLRRVALASLLLALAGIILTRSLAAVLVALALGILAGVGATYPLKGRWVAIGLVGGLAAGAVGVFSRPDVLTLAPIRLRLINWSTAWEVLLRNPWSGVGPGGMGQAGLTSAAGALNITPFAHNSYLQILTEFGIAGLGVSLLVLVWFSRLIRCGLRDQRPLALAVLAVPLHNFVDFSFYSPEVLLPWCVLLGTLAARTLPLPARPMPGRILVPVLAAGCLASALTWRSEMETRRALVVPGGEAVPAALDAARWAPWSVSPLYAGVDRAYEPGVSMDSIVQLEAVLHVRRWVRPRSSASAEGVGRLLLLQGRSSEALPWIREARRRAPWRKDLEVLEAACIAGR